MRALPSSSKTMAPAPTDKIAVSSTGEVFHLQIPPAELSRPLSIVALGGGTGLSTLLRGLRILVGELESRELAGLEAELSAIVTVTDDGGSSGRLRRDFDMLAPGDIRNCMVALAEDEALLSKLFRYRFEAGEGLEGHSFGNLFLTALSHVTGDFHQAIRLSSEVLAIRGQIFPSTLSNVTLEAQLQSGRSMVGESSITGCRDGIKRIHLRPRSAPPAPGALNAIAGADLITLGPGSLYTSVIPNLLIDGVAEAIAQSPALKVYICNLMWEPGETEDYSAEDHVQAVLEHSVPGLIDLVVVNNKAISASARKRYAKQNAFPVELDEARLRKLVPEVLAMDLVAKGLPLRHDADRLARVLLVKAQESRARRVGAEKVNPG
ncbi:MAG: YvcK family protein [Bryobacterales bacterium]